LEPPKRTQISLADVPREKLPNTAAEKADITWQLRGALEPLLKEKGPGTGLLRVESPLVPVLGSNGDIEGINWMPSAARRFSGDGRQLSKEIDRLEKTVAISPGRPSM